MRVLAEVETFLTEYSLVLVIGLADGVLFVSTFQIFVKAFIALDCFFVAHNYLCLFLMFVYYLKGAIVVKYLVGCVDWYIVEVIEQRRIGVETADEFSRTYVAPFSNVYHGRTFYRNIREARRV